MTAPWTHESRVLLDMLNDSGAAILKHFSRRVQAETKSDSSLVTAADLESESLIIDRIRHEFPGDLIFAEESGVGTAPRHAGQRVWVIDPLDGTTNFAHGYPCFCVSIALGHFDERGRITVDLGGIRDPLANKTWTAVRGQGAFRDGRRLAVNRPQRMEDAFLVTGFYYFRNDDLRRELAAFERISSLVHAVRRDGSAALDLALTAEGIFDGFWERGLKVWDVAAGKLLVEEAGGTVLNYGGGMEHNIEGDGLVAGCPDVVRGILAQI